MFFASLVLCLLAIAAPLTTIFNGPLIDDAVVAASAISVAAVALRIRSNEGIFLLAVSRPIMIVAAVPAFWMLFQVLPLQRFGLANSIWQSAASALGYPIAGSISIDPGATVTSLMRYLSALSMTFAAAALTVDRKRAEWALFALVAATALIAIILVVAGLGNFSVFRGETSSFSVSVATAGVALGIVLATAGALHRFEHDHRRALTPNDAGAVRYRPTFGAYLAALVICSVALPFGAIGQTYFAVGGGIAVLIAASIIRRFKLGSWGISAILSLSILGAALVIVPRPGVQNADLVLAFAPRALAPLIEATQRILADAGWAGFGGGTFGAVLPIYRDANELAIGSVAPTGAAAIALEMGRPFLWIGLFFVIVLIFILIRGALRRQRDSVYSTAGASCGVVVTLLAFCDVSLFSTPVLIILAPVIGMAIAQSQPRLSW